MLVVLIYLVSFVIRLLFHKILLRYETNMSSKIAAPFWLAILGHEMTTCINVSSSSLQLILIVDLSLLCQLLEALR